MISESLQQALAEVEKLPDAEQDMLVGLMQAHLIRKRLRSRAFSYNTKLWARLRQEDPEYIKMLAAGHRRNMEKASHFIRLILLVDWDPIGTYGYPKTEDEYDRYVSGIYDLMLTGAPVEGIVEHLHRIEQEQMGLGGGSSVLARRAVLTQVAEKLIDLRSLWHFDDTLPVQLEP